MNIIERSDKPDGTIQVLCDDGRRYDIVPDIVYQTRGSYGYDTAEETKAAEDEEIAKLRSGEWVVYGVKQFEKCDQPTPHCSLCNQASNWVEASALWGIVIQASAGPLDVIKVMTGED